MLKFSSTINISNECKELIIKSLPQKWETEVKEVNVEKNMEIFIRINAKTLTDIQNWIASYQQLTNSSYSVESTYKCSGQRVLFKRSYHCQHRTRHKETYDPIYRRSIKNTNCPAIFSVAVRTIKKRYQGKDKSRAPDQNKPCEIRLKLQHNHSTTNSMALKFKKVLPEVKEELLRLFNQGHTTTTALQTLKSDIALNFTNFDEILMDRSRCPDYSYCHYLYQKFLLSKPIVFNNEFIRNKLDEYNCKMNDISAKMEVTENGFVICLCPPLVRRIHQHQPSASEVVFMDSFLTCDKNSSKVFILVTESESGGLPLGVIITSSNSLTQLKLGLNLLKEMLGEFAFAGNVNGPKIFLTDEYIIQNNIISSFWPNSKNLLSIFHVLQNVWKWLQSTKHNISINDRPVLFKDFYNLLYVVNESEFLSKFVVAEQNAVKYKHYLKYLKNYFECRHLWAVCYRPNQTEPHCNSEVVMRMLRDKIFQRLKSFNLVQMVDFIINNFFRYFERQLLNIAHNQNVSNIFNVFCNKTQLPSDDILNKIQVLDKIFRLVPSEKINDLFYMVNTDLLTCTCFNGNSNAICKHVQWICTLTYNDEIIKNAKNAQIRKKCFVIATGNDPPDLSNDLTNEKLDEASNVEFIQELFQNNQNNELYAMETTDIDEYLILKKQDDNVKNCRRDLKIIMNKFEELLQQNPEKLLLALRVFSSRFDSVNSVSDLSRVFSLNEVG